MSDFKKAYLALKTKDNYSREIQKKKTGRPSMLPEDLIKKSVDTVPNLRLKGADAHICCCNKLCCKGNCTAE